MMSQKILLGVSCLGLMVLMGCSSGLNTEDRALLLETKATAEKAEEAAAQAAADAKAARELAEKAAKDAQAASEKADRMFEQGQRK